MAKEVKEKYGWAEEVIIDSDNWLDDEHLILIAGWARDGYTFKDIARKIGISISAFNSWRRKYPQFNDAMKEGREIVDYKVENALLKSALGFETKESKVTVLMRYGKVVEETTETTTKEIAPNVAAIQTWLYNRLPDKWSRRNGNLAEDLGEDDSIKIEVTRAKRDELNATKIEGSGNDDDSDWSSVNESLTVRKATEEEKQEAREAREARKQKKDSHSVSTIVEEEPEDSDSFDEDYWPEDDEWEEMQKQKAARKHKKTNRNHSKTTRKRG